MQQTDDFCTAAALRLPARLDQCRAATSLVELLPKLPEELWPQAGEVLHRLTGEDVGPHAGAKAFQVRQIRTKWRAWLKEHAPE